MTSEYCATVAQALETIDSFAELEAFAEALRKPPAGSIAKPVTEAEWATIARMKIIMQKNGASRK